MKQITFLLLMLTFILSACSGASPDEPVNSETPNSNTPPTQSDYSPKPEDAVLTRGGVFLSTKDLLTMESYPLQFMLSLAGELPTPCHQLRVLVNPPDAENKILVDVYSVTDPTMICTQVTRPFEVNVPLGSFATGYYILLVNGEQTAEFDA